VALKNGILFFFEVKTRTCDSINAPEESITYQKRQKLIRTAMTFLENKSSDLPIIKSWRIAFFGILLRGGKVIKTETFIID
jgi:Holliday junction resolvase-like predicted endonuclease